VETVSGTYFDVGVAVESSAASRDPASCARLWQVSEELVSRVNPSETASG